MGTTIASWKVKDALWFIRSIRSQRKVILQAFTAHGHCLHHCRAPGNRKKQVAVSSWEPDPSSPTTVLPWLSFMSWFVQFTNEPWEHRFFCKLMLSKQNLEIRKYLFWDEKIPTTMLPQEMCCLFQRAYQRQSLVRFIFYLYVFKYRIKYIFWYISCHY